MVFLTLQKTYGLDEPYGGTITIQKCGGAPYELALRFAKSLALPIPPSSCLLPLPWITRSHVLYTWAPHSRMSVSRSRDAHPNDHLRPM